LSAFVRPANAKQGDQDEGGDAATNDTKESDIKSAELGDGKPGRCGRQREQRDCEHPSRERKQVCSAGCAMAYVDEAIT
jgi:hypothetical protein